MLLYLIKLQQPDIDKIYFNVNDPIISICQFLINGRENVGITKVKHQKAFIDYSQTIVVVYENLEDYYPTIKRRVLIVFDDIIADMECYKN